MSDKLKINSATLLWENIDLAMAKEMTQVLENLVSSYYLNWYLHGD